MLMKKYYFLLMLLIAGSGVVEASLVVEPVEIPGKYSDEDVLILVERAAKHRGWSIIDVEKDSLTINIVRRGYDSTLEFYIENKNVQYEDDTTARIRLPRKSRKSNSRWRESVVPVDWVNTIMRDVNNSLESENEVTNTSELKIASVRPTIGPGCDKKVSAKDTEKRLKSLKKMFRKKLINQSEYDNKKSEILACF